jgi:alpha-glucosidase
MPDDWGALTVEAELADPASMLELYTQALALRRKTAELSTDEFTWLDGPDGCLTYRRGKGFVAIVNVSGPPAPLPSDEIAVLGDRPF